MKKILSLVLATVLIACMLNIGLTSVSAASNKWNGGTSNFIGYTGQGTEESPYYIYTAEQLAYLAKNVTDSTTYNGVYFKLGNDIILNDATLADYTNSNRTPYLKVWTPIGTNCKYSAFGGIFDGAGHTIKGVYTKTGYSGLFKRLGPSAIVKNLGVITSYISDEELSEVVGGIAAENDGTIKNCYFRNSTAYSSEVGGIVGYNYGTIINCFNQSTIKGRTSYNRNVSYATGGIAGINDGDIEYCFNTGYISGGYNGNSGGITGKDEDSIENCFNSGDVYGSSGNAGGIAGNKTYGSIYNCYNEGDISGNVYIGGICGYTSGRIYDSYNSGAITATQYGGGIAGTAYAAENCYNVGAVKGTAYYPGAVLGGSRVASKNCYYLKGAGNARRGDLSREDAAGAMVGCTADELKLEATYSGFDFDTDWKFSDSYNYPILRAINSSVDEIENENAKWTEASGDCTIAFNGRDFIISGSGNMGEAGQSNDSPWMDLNQKVIVEEGVTSIGNYFFNNCTNIKELSMADSVTRIGSHTFNGCTGIKTVKLSDNLEEIWENAFYGCTGLTEVVFGKADLDIRANAFSKCTALGSADLSNLNSTIYDYTFSNCSSLESVSFGNTVIFGDNAFEKTALREVLIPETVVLEAANTFYACESLTKATVNTKVITVKTFLDCVNLSELILGESVESIASGAFENCAITELNIPASMKLVYGEAFRNCRLENVSVAEGNEKLFCVDNCVYRINDLGENELIIGCKNSVISPKVDFDTIRPYAFQYCTTFETVTIPETVSLIDEYAFWNCSEITTIYLPEGMSFIGDSAFEGCDSIKTVYYAGTEEQWNELYKGENNSSLIDAEIIYNYKPVIIGDVDGDGKVNAVDLTNIKTAMFADSSVADNESLDINGDNVFNIIDVIKMKLLLLEA